jgi:hypothetical protein
MAGVPTVVESFPEGKVARSNRPPKLRRVAAHAGPSDGRGYYAAVVRLDGADGH